MEKQTSKSSIKAVRFFYFITILGFIFCIGSIFTFIVMNIVLGDTPTVEAIYWQRLFVSKITNVLILPGIALLVIGVIGLTKYGFFRSKVLSGIQILVIVIVLNSIHITILANKVTGIAIRQYEISAMIKDYLAIKSKEDIFGGVNMILLLICLILGITSATQKKSRENVSS